MQQKKIFKPIRIAALILLPLIFAAICAMALYDLQIVNGAAYLEKSQNTIVTRERIEASRGIVLDRYGRTLVSNRITYRVVISRTELVAGGRPNEDLLTLIACADKLGLTYEETLPVSRTAPFTYTEPASETVEKRLKDYIDHFDLDDDISAPRLIEYMRRHYSIPEDFTDEQARLAAGLRRLRASPPICRSSAKRRKWATATAKSRFCWGRARTPCARRGLPRGSAGSLSSARSSPFPNTSSLTTRTSTSSA